MSSIDLAFHLDRFVRHLHVTLHTKAKDFDPDRVGPGGAMILLSLSDMGTAGLNELTRRLARDKSQMTRAIQMLEGKGMVTRQQSPDDARVSLVALTEKGQALVDTHHRVLAETLDELLSPISPEDRAVLEALLKQAVERI